MIQPTVISLIKANADLRKIAGQYVKLRKQGSRVTGLCPFHSEKTASFSVHHNFFCCFSCDAKGDVFTFLQRIEGISFQQAAELLADQLGLTLSALKAPRNAVSLAIETEAQCVWWWQRMRQTLIAEQTTAFETCRVLAIEPRRTIAMLNDYHQEASTGIHPVWLCTLGQLDCEHELDEIEWPSMIEAHEWARTCTKLLLAIERMPATERYKLFKEKFTAADRDEWCRDANWDKTFAEAWMATAVET